MERVYKPVARVSIHQFYSISLNRLTLKSPWAKPCNECPIGAQHIVVGPWTDNVQKLNQTLNICLRFYWEGLEPWQLRFHDSIWAHSWRGQCLQPVEPIPVLSRRWWVSFWCIPVARESWWGQGQCSTSRFGELVCLGLFRPHSNLGTWVVHGRGWRWLPRRPQD